jgi:hypothetical protein
MTDPMIQYLDIDRLTAMYEQALNETSVNRAARHAADLYIDSDERLGGFPDDYYVTEICDDADPAAFKMHVMFVTTLGNEIVTMADLLAYVARNMLRDSAQEYLYEQNPTAISYSKPGSWRRERND